MSAASEDIIQPLGLVTQPNKFGQYPAGALKTATGVVIRDKGIIRTHGWFKQLATGPWSSSDVSAAHIIPSRSDFPYTLILYSEISSGNWKYAWLGDDGTVTTGTTFTIPVYTDQVTYTGLGTSSPEVFGYSHSISRGRVVVAMRDSTMVFDCPRGATPGAPRVAGISPPRLQVYADTSSTATAIPLNTHCSVTAIVRRKQSDGYELISAPACAQDLMNINGPGAYDVGMIVIGAADWISGDVVEIYRTKTQAANSSGVTASGSEYMLCGTVTMVDPSIANSVVISSTDDQLGQFLYTNPGQQGAGAANLMPLPCKAVATFKGYTFYGSITEPPQISLKSSVAWTSFSGSTSVPAAVTQHSTGIRWVSSTYTAGNSTITCSTVGLVVGQIVGIPTSGSVVSRISSVGSGSVTVTVPPSSSGTGANVYYMDTLKLLIGPSTYRYLDMETCARLNADLQADGLYVYALDLVPWTQGTTSLQSVYVTPQPIDAATVQPAYLANYGPSQSITYSATKGSQYIPAQPRTENGELKTVTTSYVGNMLMWSEEQQPEHVPSVNEVRVGHGDIIALVPTRDALWIFCTDGLWRLSGTGGAAGSPGFDWRIDPVDPTLVLQSRRSWCVSKNVVYALTNRGFVRIESSGLVSDLSQGRLADWFTGKPFSESYTNTWLTADELYDEIYIYDSTVPRIASNILIYSERTDTFTQAMSPVGAISGSTWLHGAFARQTQTRLFIPSASNWVTTVSESSAGSTQLVTLDYQPIYGADPFVLRRWQRVYLAMSTLDGSTSSIVPTINSGTVTLPAIQIQPNSSGSAVTSQGRSSFAVPRNAPAVSNCIGFGLDTQGTYCAPFMLYASSLESFEFTRQRRERAR